jgi:hypothetical protein
MRHAHTVLATLGKASESHFSAPRTFLSTTDHRRALATRPRNRPMARALLTNRPSAPWRRRRSSTPSSTHRSGHPGFAITPPGSLANVPERTFWVASISVRPRSLPALPYAPRPAAAPSSAASRETAKPCIARRSAASASDRCCWWAVMARRRPSATPRAARIVDGSTAPTRHDR